MTDDIQHLMPAIIALVDALPAGTLEALAHRIAASTPQDRAYAAYQIQQVVPQPALHALVTTLLDTWQHQAPGIAPGQVALMLCTAAATARHIHQQQTTELVWTGPLVVGSAMRRTDQALLHVINMARQSVLVVSFAVYNIPTITQALVRAARRGVTLRICVEAPEPGGQHIAYDTLAALGADIAHHAQIYIWPRDQRPTGPGGKPAALHAKCAVADARMLFISSANLTEYAMNLNMELGVLISGGILPQTVAAQFDTMIAQGILQRVRS